MTPQPTMTEHELTEHVFQLRASLESSQVCPDHALICATHLAMTFAMDLSGSDSLRAAARLMAELEHVLNELLSSETPARRTLQ